MKKEKLISVVIPIHNIEDYLPQCIESILAQTYKNLEIILVNDGSTDNSKKICEKYAKKDNRIKLINKNNGGLISARKSGVAVASGEYISYVDGDDWLKPQFFQTIINYANETNADIVIGGHIEKWSNYEETQINKIQKGIYTGKNLEKIYSKMLFYGKFSQPGIFSYVWGKLYKKELVKEFQLAVDDKIFIGEDAACLYPCILKAKKIQIVDDANYFYRQRIGSMIKSPDKYEEKKISRFYEYLKNFFTNSKYRKKLINQLNYFTLSLLTVRSSFVPSNFVISGKFYPFDNVYNGEKVILYGAGTFGQILYSRIVNSNELDLITWVDDIYYEYRKMGLNVNPPEQIHKLDYDKILLAYIDEEVSNKIKKNLIASGISSNKIGVVIYHNMKNITNILKEYGVNVEI